MISLFGGMLLVVLGLVTYPIPGPPSTLMIVAGLAMIAQEWMWVARRLDASEVRLHAAFRRAGARWRALSGALRMTAGFLFLLLLAGCAWGVYLVFAG